MTPVQAICALRASVDRLYADDDMKAFRVRQRALWDRIALAGLDESVLASWRARSALGPCGRKRTAPAGKLTTGHAVSVSKVENDDGQVFDVCGVATFDDADADEGRSWCVVVKAKSDGGWTANCPIEVFGRYFRPAIETFTSMATDTTDQST